SWSARRVGTRGESVLARRHESAVEGARRDVRQRAARRGGQNQIRSRRVRIPQRVVELRGAERPRRTGTLRHRLGCPALEADGLGGAVRAIASSMMAVIGNYRDLEMRDLGPGT